MTAENPIYDLLIDTLQTRKVSDFHMHADRPVHVRESGEIIPLNFVATNDLLADLCGANLVTRSSRNSTRPAMWILPSNFAASVSVPMATR